MSQVRVQWGDCVLGEAVLASERERLRKFVRDEESEPIALFSPEHRACSDSGDWYGEHAGKWLVAASDAWNRTQDGEWAAAIARVVVTLAGYQEEDGYLGTYRKDATCRFTSSGASKTRTWDLWVHAWAILGLLRARDVPGCEAALSAAARIGDLLVSTFPEVHGSILDLGNHAGLSSSIVLEPLAELTLATGDERYLGLANATVEALDARLRFFDAVDVSEIGTGKAYQICWTLVGLVAMYRASGETRLLQTAQRLWDNIAAEHLTPLGGPWGGIGAHKEVFNVKGFFSPYGMVETCSAATWMTLSRSLFEVTREERYAEAFERTLLNTVLGAVDANGRDWCYFTFPNGRRNNTYHWACCKSSGAMALEEAARMAVVPTPAGVYVNLLLPLSADVAWKGVPLKFQLDHEPANDGEIVLEIEEAPAQEVALAIRIPHWAKLGEVRIGEEPLAHALPTEGYLWIRREWRAGDRVRLELDCPIQVHPKTYGVDHHGQEVVRMDYAHISRGPYVYATGLIDGFRKEETLRLARLTPEAPFRLNSTLPKGAVGPLITMHEPGRDPIPFLPYFEAGGRHEGAWRTTWLQVAWQ